MSGDEKWHGDENWHIYSSLPISIDQMRDSVERELMYTALKNSGFNMAAAAREVGLSYRMFRYRAKATGIKAKRDNGNLSMFDRLWPRLRMDTIKRYGARCHCCGASAQDGVRIEVDHIKPRSKYPELELSADNLQILCRPCNSSKGPNDETDWRPKPSNLAEPSRNPDYQ